MSIYLKIEGNDEKFVVELRKEEPLLFGRSSFNDIQLKDDLISSNHLKITLTSKTQIEFEDLNSTNGSYLNGDYKKQSLLKINDKLRKENL